MSHVPGGYRAFRLGSALILVDASYRAADVPPMPSRAADVPPSRGWVCVRTASHQSYELFVSYPSCPSAVRAIHQPCELFVSRTSFSLAVRVCMPVRLSFRDGMGVPRRLDVADTIPPSARQLSIVPSANDKGVWSDGWIPWGHWALVSAGGAVAAGEGALG